MSKRHRLELIQGKTTRPPEIVLGKDYRPNTKQPFNHTEASKQESLRRLSLANYHSDPDRFLTRINRKHRGEQ